MRPRSTASALTVLALALAGCGYAELAKLYFQEKQYVEDREVVARVRGALLAEPGLDARKLHVDAYLEDVELSGTIPSPEAAARAEEIARETSGVRSVRSRLAVEAPR